MGTPNLWAVLTRVAVVSTFKRHFRSPTVKPQWTRETSPQRPQELTVSTNLVTGFTIHSKPQLHEHNSVAPLTPGIHVESLLVQRVSRQGKRCDLIILCRGSVVLCITTLNWKR